MYPEEHQACMHHAFRNLCTWHACTICLQCNVATQFMNRVATQHILHIHFRNTCFRDQHSYVSECINFSRDMLFWKLLCIHIYANAFQQNAYALLKFMLFPRFICFFRDTYGFFRNASAFPEMHTFFIRIHMLTYAYDFLK